MSTYRYVAVDLRTGTVEADLPLSDVVCSRVLNGAGPFTAKLRLPLPTSDDNIALAAAYKAAVEETKRAIYVERDGVVVWAGPVWITDYDSETQEIDLKGAEFWSYWRRRRIRWTVKYLAVDQIDIAQGLMARSQLPTAGNLGFTEVSSPSPVLRDRTYNFYEEKPVAEAIEQLAAVDGGFDFSMEVTKVGLGYERRFRTYYPRKGRATALSGLIFTYGSNLMKFSLPRDGTASANSVAALGSGEGTNMLRSVATDASAITAGYPLLEASTVYKDVRVRDTLAAHARGDLAAMERPVATPRATVLADLPAAETIEVGDDARLVVPAGMDSYWPTGLDLTARITTITFRPPDAGEIDQIDLSFEDQAA